jgi:hypothetical protein
VEARERSLTASPPFPVALAVLLLSFLHLEPELDQAAPFGSIEPKRPWFQKPRARKLPASIAVPSARPAHDLPPIGPRKRRRRGTCGSRSIHRRRSRKLRGCRLNKPNVGSS